MSMKVLNNIISFSLLVITIGVFSSCSQYELPEHSLDVEFKYELTCSEGLLKYVTPQVTITDTKGVQQTISIEDGMWKGTNRKTWTQSFHYDSVNVSNMMTVRYIPKSGITYQDEVAFDNAHNLSCYIIVQEDGDGIRNDYTIIPDFPSAVDVKADVLENYIERLSQSATTRGGKVDSKGEVTKIEND